MLKSFLATTQPQMVRCASRGVQFKFGAQLDVAKL